MTILTVKRLISRAILDGSISRCILTMGYENSGRRPQPTALKMLRGNPGKRQPNQLEPRPPSDGEPAKPKGLSADAAEVWDEIAPVLLYMRTLTPADAEPFARMCELTVTARASSMRKAEPGFEYFSESGQVHGAIRLERDTATALRPYYEYFGMTPSARARIQVAPQKEEPISKWAGVLK